ncbi:hypothetical protein ACFPCW_17390 [Vibrio thalassae]|uniref:hypothetical protein n=1 Tax=Vibrio thalassae TaxID=1243014 RepID=UPI00361AF46D
MAALQVLIDRVDASLLAFAEFKLRRPTVDVNGISYTTLGNILGLTLMDDFISSLQLSLFTAGIYARAQ